MTTPGRVVGLDLGSKRIGVAVCDDSRILATPYGTIKRVGDQVVEHAEIANVVDEISAVLIVIGLPIDMRGDEAIAAKSVLKEAKKMGTRIGVPVETHDERLTTVTANDFLSELGVRGRDRKDKVDQLAASVILQSWIDSKSVEI